MPCTLHFVIDLIRSKGKKKSPLSSHLVSLNTINKVFTVVLLIICEVLLDYAAFLFGTDYPEVRNNHNMLALLTDMVVCDCYANLVLAT